MRWIGIALRRLLRDGAFLAALLLCALVLAFAPAAGASTAYPPAGFFDADGGKTARRLGDLLSEAGLVRCDSEKELLDGIATGKLDCGILIPEGLEDCLRQREGKEALTLVTAPSSAMAQAHRFTAAAALFRLTASRISGDFLRKEGLTQAEVDAAYEGMLARGLSFSFRVSSVSVTVEGGRARGLTLGALAVLLFLLVTIPLLLPAREGLRRGALSLGLRRALVCELLPLALVRAAAALLAAGIGLCAAGAMGADFAPGLFGAAAVYVLLLVDLTFLLAALLPTAVSRALLALMTVAGLALSPLYTDLAALLPRLRPLRLLTPIPWMWRIAEKPWPWLAAGLLLLPVSVLLLALLRAARDHLRL